MTYNELKRLLKKNNCELYINGANRNIWINKTNGRKFVIGRHGSQEVKTGTCKAILKQAGIK
mgnify:FL=1